MLMRSYAAQPTNQGRSLVIMCLAAPHRPGPVNPQTPALRNFRLAPEPKCRVRIRTRLHFDFANQANDSMSVHNLGEPPNVSAAFAFFDARNSTLCIVSIEVYSTSSIEFYAGRLRSRTLRKSDFMQELTPEGHRVLTEIAQRHGVSLDAALALLVSLLGTNGSQAQFNHPDLGGMGQWSQGGMIMIGDMFNQNLKYRVSELCNELAGYVRSQPPGTFQSQSQSGGSGVSLFVAGSSGGEHWWPQELGTPASAGAQNDMRYAYFPESRRLAILQGGVVRIYDSGDHKIAGFSQAQGGDQTLTFTSQLGLVRVADLALVSPLREPAFRAPHTPDRQSEPPRDAPAAIEAPAPAASHQRSQISGDAVFAAIERLADLRQKNILSEEEFAAKKRELLGRI